MRILKQMHYILYYVNCYTGAEKNTITSVCIWMDDNKDKIFDFANLIKNQLKFYLVFNGCMHIYETFLTIQFASR